jgi:hypothetical protein
MVLSISCRWKIINITVFFFNLLMNIYTNRAVFQCEILLIIDTLIPLIIIQKEIRI